MESSPSPMKELWLACVPFVRKFPLSVGVFWYRLAVEA
jgi:hypothetical protein